MRKLFLRIFDFFEKRRWLMWLIASLVVAGCAFAASRIEIGEDITAFLPLDRERHRQMELYGQFSGSEKIVVIFENKEGNREKLMDAIDSFDAGYGKMQLKPKLVSRIDVYDYLDVLDSVYLNMPYVLTDRDYARMDSILRMPEYVDSMMRENRRQILMPISVFEELRIKNDPLNLFEPVVSRLMGQLPYGGAFCLYDGYMLSKDGTMGIAWLETPYGQSETQQNAMLTDSLLMLCGSGHDVDVRLTGAPVIAVENARCIKHDSLIAGIVALVIILVLLFLVLRSVRPILLILLAVGFGWVIALAAVSVAFGSVSMIVIGMGSVLTGIAVNYPLHVVMHHNYTDDVRSNLSELVAPLVIGNITTVGAFCALLPLDGEAMMQLGLFAAALLVGTILFSVVVLPHILPAKRTEARQLLRIMPSLGLKGSIFALAAMAAVTVLLAFFIPSTSFDTNLSNINYMTDEQRSDIAMITSMTTVAKPTRTLFIMYDEGRWNVNCRKAEEARVRIDSLVDEGLLRNVSLATDFMPSRKVQEKRIAAWEEFVEKHRQQIDVELNISERKCGFSEDAFALFKMMRHYRYAIRDSVAFVEFASMFMPDKVRHGVICEKCQVAVADEEQVIDRLGDDVMAFTMESNNSSMAERLADEFDYIGIVCSLIVFIFLWISFRRIGLALLAFLPMAVSWVWILGIMGIAGIKFNIVNIILATFIFGQGDDYTIFMVEGVMHEHKTGTSILPQYRTEILMSAIIMLVGIGTLVISHHPAMHSLGMVTLIGMSVVVVMAYLLPQAIFNIYLKIKNNRQ